MGKSRFTEESVELALAKWEQVKMGQDNVIVDDETLEILSEHFNPQDSLEADIYFRYTSSPLNPNQLGTRDCYVLSISEAGLHALNDLESPPTIQM